MFCKAFESIRRKHFLYVCQFFHCFCRDFLSTRESLSFQNHFIHINRKTFGSGKSREYGGCSEAITFCLAKYFLTSKNQSAVALSCRSYSCIFFWMFLSYCIPEASPDHSFISHIAHTFDVFIIFRSWWFPAVWIVIDTHIDFMKMLNCTHKPAFFHCHLTTCFFKQS